MNERVIFDAALQIVDPQARRAFVEKACAGRPEMLVAVESLLKSHDAVGSFLDIPAAEQIQAGAAGHPEDSAAAVEKTQSYQAGDADNDTDEAPPDLSFLQPSSKPGSIGLLGHYEVLQVLGQGGFGTVLKAFDEKLHRLVAIKVMNAQMAATSPPRKRFLREARAAAGIRHENIVQVHSVEELPLPYLVMEFIDGQTLRQKLDGAGPLEVPEVLHIGRQIASGLAAAQAMGLIHRDIKPGNILIEEAEGQGLRGEGKKGQGLRAEGQGQDKSSEPSSPSPLSSQPSAIRVKITDFGLARAADDASLTRSGTISGTPMYMAPEQALGRPLDHRADLFSLGSVLYELTCGRPPFRAPTTVAVLLRVAEDTPRPMQEIIPEIPDWLVAIVTKLHAKKPEDRFQTAKEVADLLTRCQTELQTKGEVTCVPIPNRDRVVHREGEAPAEPFTSARRGPSDISARRGSPDPAAPADRRSPLPGESTPKDGDLRSSPSAGSGDPRTARLNATARSNVARWLAAAVIVFAVLAGILIRSRSTEISNLKSQISNPPGQAESTDSTNPDRRAAEWVLLIGGGITIKENGEERGINSGRDLPDGAFELTAVFLAHNLKVSDAGLAHFKDCKNVTSLDLFGTIASDTGLANFKNCKNLKALGLAVTKVTDAGLEHFKDCKNLILLDVNTTTVSDVGLAYFEDCKNLEVLRLGGTRVSDAGLAYFKDCQNLAALSLLVAHVGDAGLAHFKNCKNLYSLDIRGTAVSDAGLSHFKDCKNLAVVSLDDTQISDAGLTQLAGCKNLERLDLGGTKVSNAGLERFTDWPRLGYVTITKTKVTESGVKKLSGVLPGCKIEWDGGVIEPRPTDPDRHAAEYVLSIGGNIKIKDNGQERAVPVVADLPRGPFELTAVTLINNPRVSDSGLANFKDCKNLTHLNLAGPQVSDAGLAHFKDCKNLTYLRLNAERVSDAGLVHFRNCKNLTLLELDGTPVTDAGVANFGDCKNLTRLFLSVTKVSDAGLANFEDCKNIDSLILSGTQVSDTGLAHFKNCPNLVFLALDRTRVSDAGLAHFKNCKNLTRLELNGTQVSDAGLAHFKDCKNFAGVELSGTQVSDTGLAHFKDCKNLTLLNLHGTQVADAGLVVLESMPSLTELHLGNTRISLNGHKQLKAALPKCQIDWLEPNRSVAESVLALGGSVEIGSLDKPESRPVQVAADLPGDYFQVRRVSLAGVTKPLDPLRPLLALLTLPQFDRLESIDLSGSTGLDYSFLVPIHGLRELTLANAGLNDAALANLPKLPTLQRLVLDGNDIRGSGLTHLSHQPELIDLSLSHPNLTSLSAENLAELKRLKRLSLAGSGMTNAGIKQLAHLTNLESLDLRRTKATATGIDELKAALPGCKIEWDGVPNK